MKFLTPWGIETLVSQTAIVFERRKVGKKKAVESPKEVETQGKVSLTEEVLVNPTYPNQLVMVGKNLSSGESTQLKTILKENQDIFAWEPSGLVDTAFQSHIGRNLEAYVDDVVVKSQTRREMISYVVETFDNEGST
nr:reverse transcriptase domain-containing protein [Tanacetum cinerariifolium]